MSKTKQDSPIKDLLKLLIYWFLGILLFIIPWIILVGATTWIIKLVW